LSGSLVAQVSYNLAKPCQIYPNLTKLRQT
jgi:hypothetical protein